MVIFKYKFEGRHNALQVFVPEKHKVLSAGVQKNEIVVWVARDEAEQNIIPVILYAIATGQSHWVIEKGEFIGTVFVEGKFKREFYHIFKG